LQYTGHYTISQQQSQKFAELSGDYNPLHVDPVYARRLQFGNTVIHGIHHLLKTWDEIDMSSLLSGGTMELPLSRLVAKFQNPARWGQVIEYSAELSLDKRLVVIAAFCEGHKILALELQFGVQQDRVPSLLLPACPPQEKPLNPDFPAKDHSGDCQLYLDPLLAKNLFPALVSYLPAQQLSQIIACTRIVGMYCPGLNSIFSGIQLNFSPDFFSDNNDTVHYSVIYSDKRVSMVNMAVDAAGMEGKLNTFVRPAPVKQPAYAEILQMIPESVFKSQRALVIGGSRGIGETTAKLLCAGGADVIITYNQGKAEAEKVAQEVTAGNGRCRIAAFDVTDLSNQSPILFSEHLLPTHIYYFASPHITANRATVWNRELFDLFCKFYLEAFSKLVALYAENAQAMDNSMTYFYPSSIFVEVPENGFAEYAVAKGAGEVLCQQLATRYPYVTFCSPRLPRILTDQTANIYALKYDAALDVMLRELKAL